MSPSICFIVTRPKKREVFAADFRDRVIHHIIMQRLEPLFEDRFIDDNYNCRKNKGVLYGVKRLHQQIKECSENYTKSCYIGKFDLQGFFMTIHKPTLWEELRLFILDKYKGSDIEVLLYLVQKVVLHHPERNCIKKGNERLWNNLPKNKSLFTCGDDYGLPIGNLTSQCFANFYLSEFDMLMKSTFVYYGRYVDDFYIICRDKNKLLKYIKPMSIYLQSKLKVRLHPNKIYIQHYSKGVKFIGAVVKKDRMYISNSTVSNLYTKIYKNNKYISGDTSISFIQSLNSYFGFLRHYRTYHIKRKICNLIHSDWYKFLACSSDYTMFTLFDKYNPVQIMRNNIKNKTINYF